jgi:hypothetical protein
MAQVVVYTLPHQTAQPPQDSLPDHSAANNIEAVKER